MARLMALAMAVGGALWMLGISAGDAVAAGSWRAETTAPTYFASGKAKETALAVSATDSAPAEELTLRDTVPTGVEIKSVSLQWSGFPFGASFNLATFEWGGKPLCTTVGQQVTCNIPASLLSLTGPIQPGQIVRLIPRLSVPASAPEGHVTNEATVEGGGLTSATSSTPVTISAHPRFEFTTLAAEPIEGTRLEHPPNTETDTYEIVNEPYRQPFTQAGAHPWGLTTTWELATEVEGVGEQGGQIGEIALRPTQDPKDIVGDLPPGLLGDPMAVPRCSLAVATSISAERCPGDTQVGVYRLWIEGSKELLGPIVNVVPETGQSAEFALETSVRNVITPLLTAHLIRTHEVVNGQTREGYGFDVSDHAVPQAELRRVEVTFWGVPGDPSHDPMRGRFCGQQETGTHEGVTCGVTGGEQAHLPRVPFLSMPTDCTAGPEKLILRGDSWQAPVGLVSGAQFAETSTEFPSEKSGVTGCNLLQFNAGTGVEVQPDTVAPDQPVGVDVGLKIPLNESPATNTTPELRRTKITLPQGMSVSPDVVDGIQACDAEGPEGINITGPEAEEVSPLTHERQLAPGHCPDASIVGTAEAITPFLPTPVKGHVYLARPGCGGPDQRACTEEDVRDGNLYRLYLELGGTGEFANTGIQFKVPLETEVNPATGQITSVSSELLQALYSEVRIHLNGGPRAPLSSPAVCGPATTTADFTPWSAPGITSEGLSMAGTPDLMSSSFFDVTGCTEPKALNPGFGASMMSSRAGKFSAFTMNLSRQDGEQYVKGIQVHTPPGLLGVLASVPLCGEPQADAGTCPESSKIGTTRVATGAGSHPFEVEGGVYLTEAYGGSPFGLSIVVHLDVGPFHLGVKVVRARIAIDPTTSQLTVTTDETGPYAVPQIVFGVPVRLKRVTVNIDRPGFMLNPTDCAQFQITANVSGAQDAVAPVSAPFAVGGCRSLAFKPHFSASTNGHTSRRRGASLDVKLSYPKGAMGNDANIAFAKVDLPKQLPSRLTTLQKACTAATFAANPANCPKASIVGIVRARTPLLPVQLEGPVYFVSHGGEAFPSLVVVLEGDGVRVDLTGTTFIDKANVTSSTFKSLPDVPVETFELYLPQGSFSALAANGNLCNARSKLKMPTEFVAQNGAVFKQTTKIAVGGCGKAKPTRRPARASRYNKGRAGR